MLSSSGSCHDAWEDGAEPSCGSRLYMLVLSPDTGLATGERAVPLPFVLQSRRVLALCVEGAVSDAKSLLG